jgi:hypothetical protein
MKILQRLITGTQTSFPTNFGGGKLSFILSFLFPECLLHCCCIYFHCSYLYNCYNYSGTLCINCWVSAFQTEISYNFLPLLIRLKERVKTGWLFRITLFFQETRTHNSLIKPIQSWHYLKCVPGWYGYKSISSGAQYVTLRK